LIADWLRSIASVSESSTAQGLKCLVVVAEGDSEPLPGLADELALERREALAGALLRRTLDWAIEHFDGSASIVDPSGIAAAAQGATTLVLVRPALVRLAAGHAEDVKGDLKSGCGLVIGPTLVGGWYLLALQPPADQLIEAAGDGSAGSAGSMIAAARGLRDIEVGLLRAERDLVRSADLTAARSDPLIDIELVGLLA